MVTSLRPWRPTAKQNQAACALVAFSVVFLGLGPAWSAPTRPVSAGSRPTAFGCSDESLRQPAWASHVLEQSRRSPKYCRHGGLPKVSRSVSGAGEAFATIFFSEIGDKSFFLTMMIAIRRGRSFALLSSQSALWLMTAISVGLGMMLRKVPRLADGHVSLNVITACLMLVFAVQTFMERTEVAAASGSHASGASSNNLAAREPLAVPKMSSSRRALVAVQAECGGEGQPECVIDYDYAPSSSLRSLFKPAALIFLSEWGDRSMLATVSLAATRSPVGCCLGGFLGHLCAGVLAVASGGFLDKYMSARMLKTISGLLFAVFGVTTLLGVY